MARGKYDRLREGRRARILDAMLVREGQELLRASRELHQARALLKQANGGRQVDLAELAAGLRRGALDRTGEAERLLARPILQDPVSAIEQRLERGGSAEGSLAAQTVRDLAGKAKRKPRFATSSPRVIARIVEAIGTRHPQIAVELQKLGLTVEEGAQLMFRILDYSKARSPEGVERRIHNRGGILFEMLLAYHPEVVAKERAVALANAADWLRQEPGRFDLDAKRAEEAAMALEKRVAAAAEPRYGRSLLASGDAPGLGEVDVIANNLYLVRLNDVRDAAGRLMSDHFRALISITTDAKTKRSFIDVVPVGVGESKFRSGSTEVLPQLIQNVGRARESLRASNLPHLEHLEVRVRWGKQLVVIGQSEKAIPPKRFEGIAEDVRKATRAGPGMKVIEARGATAAEAASARKVTELFLKLVEESANVAE